MKLSLNLLKKFTEITLPEPELLERIASRIGEIETVERLDEKYARLIIGRIVAAEHHPDADKLGLYQVDIGASKPVQVVAGDKKLQPGDSVCYIPPGATVPATIGSDQPLVIAKRELRGQTSNGMLASAKELDLGTDHYGVLVLDTDAAAGQPFAPVYELDDTIIEVENKVLTHRPDCFGHIGFAREVAGIQGVEFTSPDWLGQTDGQLQPSVDKLNLTPIIEVPELCRRLTLAGFSMQEPKATPLKIRTYLQRLGVRAVNAPVDLTNYLMLVSGQPLHCFDYDKLAGLSDGEGVELHVRQAHSGEKLALLNGTTIELAEQDLVIATDKTVVSLAGIMGGAATEVDASSQKIVLEVANFDMYAIRNSSMRHGLFTDAVTRFSRGLDPTMCAPVQLRAAKLLQEHLDVKVASQLLDVYEQPSAPAGIVVEAKFINSRLGSDYPIEKMAKILNNVEVDTVVNKQNLDITPPSWRSDLGIDEDIVEEIGRLNGYDELPVTLPLRPVRPAMVSAAERLSSDITYFMRSSGAHEVLTYSGVSGRLLQRAQQDDKHCFVIKNALSPELEFMRLSLTPSLLDKVYANLRQGFDQFALFELGTTHHKALMADNLPIEQPTIALTLVASKKTSLATAAGSAYFQAAHWLRQLLKNRTKAQISFKPLSEEEPALAADAWLMATSRCYEPNRAAIVSVDVINLGVVGEYKASVSRAFKLPVLSAGFELHRDRLLELDQPAMGQVYERLSRFPKVENDITLSVNQQLKYDEIRQALAAELANSGLKSKLAPLDIWQAQEGSRHLTFRVWLWHDDRTLTSSEANAALDAAAASVNETYQAERI